MKKTTLLLSTSLLFAFSGCCLKSIEIEPHMNNVDIKTATVDSAYAKLQFELKDCCPTKSQKETIAFLESQTRKLYLQLINNEITLDDYNSKIEAAKNAIDKVVLHCNKTAIAPLATEAQAIEANSTRTISKSVHAMTSEDAWQNLDSVSKGL